ncbi:MAG: acyl-CoA reductase [Ruminiclostridium sp.]
MILYGGEIFDTKEQERLIAELDGRICRTLAEKALPPEIMISAAEKLRADVMRGEFDQLLFSQKLDNPQRYKALVCAVLSRESLEQRLSEELGGYPREKITNPPQNVSPKLKISFKPLGTIFHIAAGNMDGLPAMSLAEGLITGNVNILKLPSADNGLSLKIISRLIEYEPVLADFIYVFDTPSSDIRAMQRLAALADGIAVWGGEAAVKAVRALAPAGAKLIEWGHKLGFCYISGFDGRTEELRGLAEHIAETKQLLCSSCQTIFIDTDDDGELRRFCEMFLPILEEAAAGHEDCSVDIRARNAILRHTEQLEEILCAKPVDPWDYKGRGCRLIIKDSGLELSPMMCSVLVKKLPRRSIVSVLRQSKGCLQTAGLICAESERAELTETLFRSGVTRVTRAAHMSAYFCGEAHDGEYPLQRYTRIINTEL